MEKQRLQPEEIDQWREWGPYLSDRQWGTVREDYSEDGNVWEFTTYDKSRSYTYRWGEDGIGGISDKHQILCFAPAFWNGKDPFLKERLFGLSGNQGIHGEDVKEVYYYAENLPSHAYMKMLYQYPQNEFPYEDLITENNKQSKKDSEFEIVDTGVFSNNNFFDIFIEYAKAGTEDILIKITAINRSKEKKQLHLLPQLWFRNTWSWDHGKEIPKIDKISDQCLVATHHKQGNYFLYAETPADSFFCNNETNVNRLYNSNVYGHFFKDGINDFIVNGNEQAINPDNNGTKSAFHYLMDIEGEGKATICLRLTNQEETNPFEDFDTIFMQRIQESDEFYKEVFSQNLCEDEKSIVKQAFSGLLWNKQYYYYNVEQWLNGDPNMPKPPASRLNARNNRWTHMNAEDILSVPDKWEFPWFAMWDSAFQCVALASVDPDFSKKMLRLLVKEWYIHPNGQFPAFEFDFNQLNPPIHSWATWKVFKMDQKLNHHEGDYDFLEEVFHKLLINFTWWVNREDVQSKNLFEGGFLGLDNIGVFDRSGDVPGGGIIEQSDATAWMAMYALNMVRISLELTKKNKVYEDMAVKFIEHFLIISKAMNQMGENGIDLWNEDDQFYYDIIRSDDNGPEWLKVRSVVGLVPLFAVEVIESEILEQNPDFAERLNWFLSNREDLTNLVSRWNDLGEGKRRLFSLLRGHRLTKILTRMLDETEFMSSYGIRSLSKYHQKHPFNFTKGGKEFFIRYQPGESEDLMFGGNSNWRGPIWFPINYMILESLEEFYKYYGDSFKVEYPTGSQNYLTLKDITQQLSSRLQHIFLKNEKGERPCWGGEKFYNNPYNLVQFHEYYHGESGKGLGAAHQTGWTALAGNIFQRFSKTKK
ncbi:MAG: hypothetical protein JXR65_09355 [Bacteroidales bacterium]|nr:hypothetical protein [Bacteroidales bacterium]